MREKRGLGKELDTLRKEKKELEKKVSRSAVDVSGEMDETEEELHEGPKTGAAHTESPAELDVSGSEKEEDR